MWPLFHWPHGFTREIELCCLNKSADVARSANLGLQRGWVRRDGPIEVRTLRVQITGRLVVKRSQVWNRRCTRRNCNGTRRGLNHSPRRGHNRAACGTRVSCRHHCAATAGVARSHNRLLLVAVENVKQPAIPDSLAKAAPARPAAGVGK